MCCSVLQMKVHSYMLVFFCGLLTTGYSYVNQCLLFFLVLMQETAMVSTQEGLILALILIGIALCIPATLFCFFFLCANVKCIGIFINYFTQFVSFVFFPTKVTQGPFLHISRSTSFKVDWFCVEDGHLDCLSMSLGIVYITSLYM